MKQKSTKPDYSKWPRKKVRITELLLDQNNIRLQIEVKSSQGAIINDLFLNENAMQILKSIAHNGLFPDELPVVIKNGTKYTVMEGNRRIAALKELAIPEIVPTIEPIVKTIKKDSGTIPKSIEVVVAPNRNAVTHFLASKHTQTMRRPWRPLRQAYFYKAELKRGKSVADLQTDYPSVNIIRFLKLINFHKIAKSISYESDQTTRKVHNERSFPATTLERLYDDKNVRNFLGFEFDKAGDVRIKIPKAEFTKGLKKILEDVVQKRIDSRTLNKEQNIVKYLKSIPKSFVPKKSKGAKTLTSEDFEEKPVPPRPIAKNKLKWIDFEFNLQSPGVERMLEELQDINIVKFPNAAHDLLRSFLECALKEYYYFRNITLTPRKGAHFVSLDTVLKKFQKEMQSNGKRALAQVAQKILTNEKMQSYTVQSLNAVNHNPYVFVIREDVDLAWDTMVPLFRHILNPKKP